LSGNGVNQDLAGRNGDSHPNPGWAQLARKLAFLPINLGRSAYCVIVIVMLAPCGLAEPDEPVVEETVT